MWYAVRIGDRCRDEVGVALGDRRRLGRSGGLRGRHNSFRSFRRRCRFYRNLRSQRYSTLLRCGFLRRFPGRFFCNLPGRLPCDLLRGLFGRLFRGLLCRLLRSLAGLLRDALALGRALFHRGLLASASGRLARLLGLALFRSLLCSRRHDEFLLTQAIVGIDVRRSVTALLPRACRTPRKPAVFAPDCTILCRARRGRSFPIPPPAVQGGEGSRWRRRRAAFRQSSDRCRR